MVGDEDDRRTLGIVKVGSYGTATSKNAVRISCRGYRSPKYPNGIPHEEAEYLSSLIPSDRGFVWTISDMVYGNEEKERLPNKTFIRELNKYEGLLELILRIEGTVVSRGTHASGAVLLSGDPYELGCFTKQGNGDIATQWDLHDTEDCGMTKFDFLLTQIEDKMVTFIKIMQKKKLWEQGTVREMYDKYLHPDVINYNDKRLWDAMADGLVVDCFQFNTPLGFSAINKCHPDSLLDLANLTSVMRLVPENGKENPVDRFKRMKHDINEWYRECREEYHLTEDEIKQLEKHFLPSYGNICQQEQFMMLLMDVANFVLMRANLARKVVSKKQMSKIPALRDEVFEGLVGKSEAFQQYIWNQGVKPLLGYGFPLAHAVPYSVIGLQCAVLYQISEIIWDTSCLIINSASAEEEEEGIIDLDSIENDDKEDDGTKRTKKTVDFEKVGQGICQMQKAGIEVRCVDINRSGYTFEPYLETNSILYGLKILTGINDEEIDTIMRNRPFTSFEDFLNKCTDFLKEDDEESSNCNKISRNGVVTLIKSGAFDLIEPNKTRYDLIVDFVKTNIKLLKNVTATTIGEFIRYSLIPKEFNLQLYFWNFRQYLMKNCQKKIPIEGKKNKKSIFILDKKAYPFYEKYFDVDLLNIDDKGHFWIDKEGEEGFDSQYQQGVADLLIWIKEKNTLLTQEVNRKRIISEVLNFTHGQTNPSAWEMETMGFYHGEHELSKVDYSRYGISNYFDLPKEPEIESYFTPKTNPNKKVPVYKLHTILGTVIAKNATRGIATIDTLDGVVNVKFTKEYFAKFDKRISEKLSGEKTGTIIDDSWFKRGSIIAVVGHRDGDNFRAKTYKNTGKHKLYKITLSEDGKDIFATSERKTPKKIK